MIQLRDKAGVLLIAGDIVVFAHAVHGLKYGVVLKTREDKYGHPRLRVHGVIEGPLADRRPTDLEDNPGRVLRISRDQVPGFVLQRLDEVWSAHCRKEEGR